MDIHIFHRFYIIYLLFLKIKKEKTTINPVDNVEKNSFNNLLFRLLVKEYKLFIIYQQFNLFEINELIYFINNSESIVEFENFYL